MSELTRRYLVMPLAADAPFDPADRDGVFVLKPWKDPAALRALAAYRDHCYPELARDLDAWIRAIENGPSVRGDVGRRNDAHVGHRGTHGRKSGATRKTKPGASGHPRPKPTSGHPRQQQPRRARRRRRRP
ncbi:MAG TPA: hypothetical protein VGR82_15970 [Methylomirabilota bacterium]|jgi:hypothetical protein|nr:hypothetical protein [Methylomirabilota bacterium]